MPLFKQNKNQKFFSGGGSALAPPKFGAARGVFRREPLGHGPPTFGQKSMKIHYKNAFFNIFVILGGSWLKLWSIQHKVY